MRPIDLVKHQTTLLPGVEFSIHTLLGALNENRRRLDLPTLILIEDPEQLKRYHERITRTVRRERKESQRFDQKKQEAEQARARIREREIEASEKKKLEEFRRKLKSGTLIERSNPADDWEEGSSLKPAPVTKRRRG